jgi:outer membrane protein TolC
MKLALRLIQFTQLPFRPAFLSLFVLCLAVPVSAQETAEKTAVVAWPQPLSLDFVLSRIDETHPSLAVVNAALAEARARRDKVEADSGINTSLVARLRWVDPPDVAYDQSQDDHSASLYVRKRLYDFGRSEAREAAAQWGVNSSEWRYTNAVNQYRIALMAAFFDAILADLKYAAANEAMSVAFVTLDRARARNELGQMSDIDLLELESEYQQSRTQVHSASYAQRTTRAHLANMLNQPENLPADLARPHLSVLGKEVPEVEAWIEEAESQNPMLKSLQAAVKNSKQQLAAAEAGDRPFMDGELEMSRYNREAGGYDEWRASVLLNVPITTGGSVASRVAEKRAQWQAAKARLEQTRHRIRQAVLETWSDLNVLKTKRDEVYALLDYRDLYLDRSRAYYELELKTDLGDAMAQVSDAQYRLAKTEFETALAWAKLDALLGRKVFENKETMP